MARSKTGTPLGLTSVELGFHFTVLVVMLDGVHVDVTQPLMVKEKFLLCLGQILVLVGQNFHLEDMNLACRTLLVPACRNFW
jgi:hypothetical protein